MGAVRFRQDRAWSLLARIAGSLAETQDVQVGKSTPDGSARIAGDIGAVLSPSRCHLWHSVFALHTAITHLTLCSSNGTRAEITGGITMTPASRSVMARKSSGVTLMVAGILFNSADQAWNLMHKGILTPGPAKLFGLLGLLMILGGAYLFWRGREYAAKADAERILTGSNPDVLYLRAFRSDQSTVGYLVLSFGTMFTDEEELADVLRPFGDLIAIGQPGEDLPKPGAARIYVSDEDWKKEVKRRMRAARLVVIRAGVGENLLWELKQAVETLNPEKVLILVLYMKSENYESFRTKVNPVLGVSLPEVAKRFRRGGFIAFAPDWEPSFLPHTSGEGPSADRIGRSSSSRSGPFSKGLASNGNLLQFGWQRWQ